MLDIDNSSDESGIESDACTCEDHDVDITCVILNFILNEDMTLKQLDEALKHYSCREIEIVLSVIEDQMNGQEI